MSPTSFLTISNEGSEESPCSADDLLVDPRDKGTMQEEFVTRSVSTPFYHSFRSFCSRTHTLKATKVMTLTYVLNIDFKNLKYKPVRFHCGAK